MQSIFVVVVNYRTSGLAVNCVASLEPELSALRGGRVIVVDNASGDDSYSDIADAIKRNGWGTWVEVVAMPHNGGFAYGNNAGIRRVREIDADFDAVVLLNPDTIAKPGLIGCLANFLDAHPEVGIAGAMIEGASGLAEKSAHAKPSPIGELESAAQFAPLSRAFTRDVTHAPRAEAHECDWVSGACMAVRRGALDSVGTLDEGFFLYFEEVDYCVRARQLGWSCWFVPEARVMHFEGASTGIRLARRRRPAYWFASRRRFFVKCYGTSGLVAADLLWGLGRLSLSMRRLFGLGGRSGLNEEPECLALDLLVGDFRALLNGELRRIPRIA